MKRIILFLLWAPVMAFGHGGHEAFYTLELRDNNWTLSVKMESFDVEAELKKNGYSTENLTAGITAYLNDYLTVYLGDAPLKMEFSSSYTSKGYIVCSYMLGENPTETNSVIIQNSCFKDYGHDYNNLVSILENGRSTHYKMDDERTEISHSLK